MNLLSLVVPAFSCEQFCAIPSETLFTLFYAFHCFLGILTESHIARPHEQFHGPLCLRDFHLPLASLSVKALIPFFFFEFRLPAWKRLLENLLILQLAHLCWVSPDSSRVIPICTLIYIYIYNYTIWAFLWILELEFSLLPRIFLLIILILLLFPCFFLTASATALWYFPL